MSNIIALNLPLNISFRFGLNLRLFRVLSLISIICLLGFYIIQVAEFARDRYILAEEREKLANMTEERAALEIDLSEIQSATNLEAGFFSQNFEKDRKTKYIQIYSPLVRNGR